MAGWKLAKILICLDKYITFGLFVLFEQPTNITKSVPFLWRVKYLLLPSTLHLSCKLSTSCLGENLSVKGTDNWEVQKNLIPNGSIPTELDQINQNVKLALSPLGSKGNREDLNSSIITPFLFHSYSRCDVLMNVIFFGWAYLKVFSALEKSDPEPFFP